MADGTTSGYSQNANKAAGGAQNNCGSGCTACNKAGLPILVTRPGLADQKYGVAQAALINPVLQGVADLKLIASGYALRTLRQGYLYAYYEAPHTQDIKAQKGWQVCKISDGGYLQPYTLGTLPKPGSGSDKPFACNRPESYATAMLFVIPDAKNTTKVWIGYSDHPWSAKVLKNYASSPALRKQRMTMIIANTATCSNSAKLTQDFVQSHVADLSGPATASFFTGNPYKPLSNRKESAQMIYAQAQWVISQQKGSKRFTVDNALVIAVPDAVGITCEAAQRRITLCNNAGDWLAKQKDGGWKLQTALTIQGLLKIIDQQGTDRLANDSSARYAAMNGKFMGDSEFETAKKSGQLPKDAELTKTYSPTPMGGMVPTYGGTVTIPDKAWIDRDTADLKSKVLEKLSGSGEKKSYQKFLDDFDAKTKADEALRSKLEADYGVWLTSNARKVVTEHDFDDTNHADGLAYAACVCDLTIGGPLTDASLAWYKDFLKEDPDDKNNLLVRAVLGNQVDFFKWLGEIDQHSKINDEIKGLFDLKPVEGALGKGTPVAKLIASAYAHPLVAVIGATLSGLVKAKEITPKLRSKVKLLTEMLMGKSEDVPAAILKVRIPLSAAIRLWQQGIGALQSRSEAIVQGVKSLVLSGVLSMELSGEHAAAETLVDLYVWARETPDKVKATVSSRIAAADTFLLQPAEANLAKAWSNVALKLDETGLKALFRNAAATLKSGSAVMSTGAGVLQIIAINEAMEKLEKGNADERKGAAFSLASAGLGLAAAAFEIGKASAEALEKESIKKGLERAAGAAAAGATLIDGMAAAIAAFGEGKDNNVGASRAHYIQALLFISAGLIGGATALGVLGVTGSTVLIGLSLTGWGLILVGLGIVAGFIATLLKDSPTQHWATKTIWGNASSKWGSASSEQSEMNKILINVEILFHVNQNFLTNAASSIAIANAAEGGQVIDAPTMTSEAILRITLPKAVKESVGWHYRIIGITSRGEKILADKIKQAPSSAELSAKQSIDSKSADQKEGDSAVIEEKIELEMDEVKSARAEVEIFDSPTATVPVISERLQ